MIDESCFWKEDLLKQADALRTRQLQRRWTEASFARLEQTVMIGFYSIRKLVEASKISNTTFEQKIPLTTFPSTGRDVTRMNTHKIDKLYDLESPSDASHDIIFLCNQFIHSFVFMPVFGENKKLECILFASDRHRHVKLFSITLTTIIELFEQVGHDYPCFVHSVFNPEKRDYDVYSTMNGDSGAGLSPEVSARVAELVDRVWVDSE
jgi:hypothetical protein